MNLTEFFKGRASGLDEVIWRPSEFVKELDKYIVGQEHAKKTMALAILNLELRRLYARRQIDLKQPIQKNNVLLIGPTGCGKTAMIKSIQEITGIVTTFYDVSGVTSSGYIGEDVSDIISRHLKNAEEHTQKHPLFDRQYEQNPKAHAAMNSAFGILYLDEFDKCRKTGENNSAGRDINGQAVQQELLKVLDGGDVPYGNAYRGTQGLFDTSNLLCVCGGAYVGLEEIVLDRLNKKDGIGIGFRQSTRKVVDDYPHILDNLETEDLIAYGYMPEILGRISHMSSMKELSINELVNVLTKTRNSIVGEYQSIFDLFGIKLDFELDALKEVAVIAKEREVGARGLRNVISDVLNDYLFNIMEISPDQTISISKETVLRGIK